MIEVERAEEERNYTVAEVFPENAGKDQKTAVCTYSYRENMTQRQLADLIGIPQRQISEMENGKRVI